MPGPNALLILQLATQAVDVSISQRVAWLADLAVAVPELAPLADSTAARVRRSRSRAHYDLFYSVEPLLQWVDSGAAAGMALHALRDKLILGVRLCTLARSCDLANMLCTLYVQDDLFFVGWIDKMGKQRVASLMGRTLDLLIAYLSVVCTAPCFFMLRHLQNPLMGLSADRIANVCLSRMGECGVNISFFKSHSLRGAAATAMMAAGAPQDLTRQRGGWANLQSFECHYGRLHQLVDWESVLHRSGGTVLPQRASTGPVGNPEHQASSSAEPLGAQPPGPEPTKEGDGTGGQRARGEALELLNATGLVQPLGGGPGMPGMCVACPLRTHLPAQSVSTSRPRTLPQARYQRNVGSPPAIQPQPRMLYLCLCAMF